MSKEHGLLGYFSKNYDKILSAAQGIDRDFYIQDCVHDVFIQISDRCPSLGFDDDKSCMSYILTAVKNRYYDMKQREDRYTTEPEDFLDDGEEEKFLKIEMSNTLDEIHNDVYELFGEEYAYVFYLRFMENLTYAAIAEETDMNTKTVGRRIAKLFDFIVDKYGV